MASIQLARVRCAHPEAITAVFPQAQVQTCVVHLIRHSLAFVSYKDRKVVAAALKQIYKANNADVGRFALDDFANGPWGKKHPFIAQSWRRNWPEVIPSLRFPMLFGGLYRQRTPSKV